MISRSAIARGGRLALRRPICAQVAQRGFGSPAPGTPGTASASYEPADIAGIKVASKDAHGPTTRLALVAKAGTRYQPMPGLTVGLEEFAFKARIFPPSHLSQYTGLLREARKLTLLSRT